MDAAFRQFKNLRYRLFYRLLPQKRVPLIESGDPANLCSWRFCPAGLDARSVIYSAGLGYDISFEHGLVQKFGCSIVMCDPSPSGLTTMALPENKIPQFKFHPLALADRCGTLNFAPPKRAIEGSWFTTKDSAGSLEVPSIDLQTLMQRNGHTRIDLLKIDIEGSEYAVLDDLLARRLPVRQILVEFHHGNLPGIRRSHTIRTILKLTAAGYRLICHKGGDHSFLHPSR